MSSTALPISFAAAVSAVADPVMSQGNDSLVFMCPVRVLQEAYADLTAPTDALSVLAIERHVLAICRESQLKLLEIYENNQRLGELFALSLGRVQATEADDGGETGEPAMVLEPADPRPPEPEIRLAAIMRRGDGRVVAVLDVDDVSRAVKVGAVLPTGHRVAAIGEGSVVLVGPDGVERRIE
ncbi:MAG: hypothetical protein OXF88_20690 [Rhodobacteraceae bacterium]|nr:hypothetical protein [Paracoccaceae bacterium]MCY4139778.1 hypothetical protein [Paracoccaceae bacterium]